MKGVSFGNLHSYDEWGLILQNKEFKSPTPKIKQVEIEGGDGFLDYTDYFGGVKYGNRSLSFQFVKKDILPDEYLELYSSVQNTIHGQKMKIILDDDPDYYYVGRVTINEWKSNKNLGEIMVEVDAEPWKYKASETVVSQAISGSDIIVLTNSRKPVVPTISATEAFTFDFGTSTVTTSAGTFVIPELELHEGSNEITVTGTGNVTFRYREGGL